MQRMRKTTRRTLRRDALILMTSGKPCCLQLGAGVGVDFAVQANFFKSGCCPLHDFHLSHSHRG